MSDLASIRNGCWSFHRSVSSMWYLWGLSFFLISATSLPAAQLVVGTVDADTFIVRDTNAVTGPPDSHPASWSDSGTAPLDIQTRLGLVTAGNGANQIPSGTDIRDFAFGTQEGMELRGGADGDPEGRASKALIRFDLTAPIDPLKLYFFEVTSYGDGTGNDTFFIYAIDNANNDIQTFDENTLTWNNAPANARLDEDTWAPAGFEAGRFYAPGTGSSPGAVLTPMLGSSIQSFISTGNCATGGGCATFGLTSTDDGSITISSRDARVGTAFNSGGAPTPARIITYTEINSTSSGALATAGTWGGNSPTANNLYRVSSGHTVSATGSAFSGTGVIVGSGGTLDLAASGTSIPYLVVNPGGSITESISGDVVVGAATAVRSGGVIINGDVSFSPGADNDVIINRPLSGAGTITFNGSGSGSKLVLAYPGQFVGTLNFAGSSEELQVPESSFEGLAGTVRMNSTGVNRLSILGSDSEQAEDRAGKVIFDQPGVIDHRSTTDRLNGIGYLEANAQLTIDLSTLPGALDERRFRVNRTLSGTADITVNGTASNAHFNASVTRAEFEVQGADQRSVIDIGSQFDNVPGLNTYSLDGPYSGTITGNDYVAIELRQNLPAAKVVANNHAIFQMGFTNTFDIPSSERATSMKFGEVVINDGGQLEVGFLEDNVDPSFQQHSSHRLHLTKEGGRNGNLTLANAATTVMQISGMPTGNQFDRIVVEGTATLGGTLQVYINPQVHSLGSGEVSPMYLTPAVGDKFDIITALNSSPQGDYDGNGIVDADDYGTWRAGYGAPVSPGEGADGNGDGVVDAADYTVWRNNLGTAGALGSIVGQFSNLIVTDLSPGGEFSGYSLKVNYVSSALVQLEVISAGSGGIAFAVPEPGVLAVLVGSAIGSALIRRRRS